MKSRWFANILIFVVSLIIIALPGELIMFEYRMPIGRFCQGSRLLTCMVSIGLVALGFLFFALIAWIVKRLCFPYLCIRNALGDNENKMEQVENK